MQLLQLSFLTLLSFFLSLSLAAPLAIPAQTLSGIGHAQVFQRSSFPFSRVPFPLSSHSHSPSYSRRLQRSLRPTLLQRPRLSLRREPACYPSNTFFL